MDDKDLEQIKATEISEVNPITKELEGTSDLFKNLGKQLTSALSLPSGNSMFPNDYGQSLKEALSAVEITGATADKIINTTSKSVALPNIPTYNSEIDEGTWITVTAEDAKHYSELGVTVWRDIKTGKLAIKSFNELSERILTGRITKSEIMSMIQSDIETSISELFGSNTEEHDDIDYSSLRRR